MVSRSKQVQAVFDDTSRVSDCWVALATSSGFEGLKPILSRPQKVQALALLIDHFEQTSTRERYADAYLDQRDPEFTREELLGELPKAVEIYRTHLDRLNRGKHDYVQLEGNNLVVAAPRGRVVAYTGTNYPIGENAAVIGALNAILAGCRMDFRLGGSRTMGIDQVVAEDVIEVTSEVLPLGFFRTVEFSRAEAKAALGAYAGAFAIGGKDSCSAIQTMTRGLVGNLQTGFMD